jgi:hypothetical protein
MLKALRIIVGVALLWGILHIASLATRDCTVGLFVFDNCLWVWLYEHLGLPSNKFLRAVALELVGLALLGGVVLTLRFVFPAWGPASARSSPPMDGDPRESKNQ